MQLEPRASGEKRSALVGLTGTMGIVIANGQHTYTFEWQLGSPL